MQNGTLKVTENAAASSTNDADWRAVQVLSDAMRPRYRSGEFAIVAPGIKPQAGDEVIVFCADGRELLRELRECGDGRVRLAAINGGALETLQREEITSIELIVGRATRGALAGIPAQQ